MIEFTKTKGMEMQRIANTVVMTAARLTLTIGLAIGLGTAAHSADPPKGSPAQAAAADSALSQGEVRQVDKSGGKLTIKHGPLVNLDMPAMTMVFRVTDAAMLDQVKSGDKIAFVAEKVNGALTVTRLEAAK